MCNCQAFFQLRKPSENYYLLQVAAKRDIFSLCKKTLQNQKCFFWRYFYFSQFTDAQASLHIQKVKISSQIIHFVKFDSFLAETN